MNSQLNNRLQKLPLNSLLNNRPQKLPLSQLNNRPQRLPHSQPNSRPQRLPDSQLNNRPHYWPNLKKQRVLVTKTANKMATTLPMLIIMQPLLRLQLSPPTQCPNSSGNSSSEVRVNLIL